MSCPKENTLVIQKAHITWEGVGRIMGLHVGRCWEDHGSLGRLVGP